MAPNKKENLSWYMQCIRTVLIGVCTAAILWVASMQKQMYDFVTTQPGIDRIQTEDIAELKDREKKKLDWYIQTNTLVTLFATQKIKEATDQMARVDSLLNDVPLNN